ncbi:MAG TPA: nickel pincer cofactor biosynthesis protein LarC [Candidatus Xenobia bacterium]|nr:nickel pincer cofactor biosynthesis protein LarC [Candidatus Xenobia bacterium]
MKICYFDCFSGIAGDMTLGALADAGADLAQIEAELRKLSVSGWSLRAEKVQRGAIRATKVHVELTEHHPHHRDLAHILQLIERAELPPRVWARATEVFKCLGEAEAHVHGIPIEKVHFHEVGAVDAIIDIVGACVGFELLGIEGFVCSPLNVGSGTVKTEHGLLPVPAPATADMLRQSPTYSTGIPYELVTPTGAALIAGLVTRFGPLPPMTVATIGYGAGSLDLKEQPNVLRIFLGEADETALSAEEPEVTILECNLDDMSPAVAGYFLDQALAAGALDVYYTPVQMKKNRPGLVLTVICPPERADALAKLIFEQTTTIGLRQSSARRRVLDRTVVTVETPLGPVRMKLARLNGRVLNAAPEYDDCQRLAREKGVPLKQVLADAQFYFRQQHKDS